MRYLLALIRRAAAGRFARAVQRACRVGRRMKPDAGNMETRFRQITTGHQSLGGHEAACAAPPPAAHPRGPAEHPRRSPAGDPGPGSFPLPTAGIQVLVIDDEESVLHVTCMMMKKLGMVPLGVTTGAQGLKHILQHPGRVQLLFLDIMLADTSGFVVYQRVRRGAPELPVVLFSGYAHRSAIQSILDHDPHVHFLAKPFAVSDIEAIVARFG